MPNEKKPKEWTFSERAGYHSTLKYGRKQYQLWDVAKALTKAGLTPDKLELKES